MDGKIVLLLRSVDDTDVCSRTHESQGKKVKGRVGVGVGTLSRPLVVAQVLFLRGRSSQLLAQGCGGCFQGQALLLVSIVNISTREMAQPEQRHFLNTGCQRRWF